jgi:hypothetical protein
MRTMLRSREKRRIIVGNRTVCGLEFGVDFTERANTLTAKDAKDTQRRLNDVDETSRPFQKINMLRVYSVLVLFLSALAPTLSRSQNVSFQNNDFIVSLEISKQTDSSVLRFSLHNTSRSSIFIPLHNFLSYRWSKTKKLFEISFGMDLKDFTENVFPLQEIKPNSQFLQVLHIQNRHGASVTLSVKGSFICTLPTTTNSELLNKDLKDEIDKWKWFEYQVPIYL